MIFEPATLVANNLRQTVDDRILREQFEEFNVMDIKMLNGKAILKFSNMDDARAAIQELHGQCLLGSKIEVDFMRNQSNADIRMPPPE